MYTWKAIALITAIGLTTTIAHADYAQLLEDCGGHTNYGLQRTTSNTNTISSDSIPTSTIQSVDKTSKESTPKEHASARLNERAGN